MSHYSQHLYSPLLEEKQEKKKKAEELSTWQKPFHFLGKIGGKIHKAVQKGYSDSEGYGGVQDYRIWGYAPQKSVKESFDFKESLFSKKPFDKNTLFNHNTNDLWHDDNDDKFGTNKTNFKGPGDEWNPKVNEPAIRAASTVHSKPHPMVIHNGINKISESVEEPFSFKTYKN